MTVTISLHYAPYSHSRDGLVYDDFLDREQTFDFEREVAEWLRAQVATGRAEVRHYGDRPSAARGYHMRTRKGEWRALAIRNHRGGGAYSRLTRRELVAVR